MVDKKITSVYETTDYSKFRFIDGNRELDHVKKVEKSIKSVGCLWQPVLCNEKYEVIEGQHRFTACKNLGLPIIYIIQPGLGIREVQALNMCSKNWTTKNHIHVRSVGELENVSYRYLELLIGQFPKMPIETIVGATSLTGLSKASMSSIKDGNIECTAKQYELAQKILKDVSECAPYVKGTRTCTKRAMVFVFHLLHYGNSDADLDTLRKKLKQYGERLNGRYMDECVQEIEDIYNYRTPVKQKKSFLFHYKTAIAKHSGGRKK